MGGVPGTPSEKQSGSVKITMTNMSNLQTSGDVDLQGAISDASTPVEEGCTSDGGLVDGDATDSNSLDNGEGCEAVEKVKSNIQDEILTYPDILKKQEKIIENVKENLALIGEEEGLNPKEFNEERGNFGEIVADIYMIDIQNSTPIHRRVTKLQGQEEQGKKKQGQEEQGQEEQGKKKQGKKKQGKKKQGIDGIYVNESETEIYIVDAKYGTADLNSAYDKLYVALLNLRFAKESREYKLLLGESTTKLDKRIENLEKKIETIKVERCIIGDISLKDEDYEKISKTSKSDSNVVIKKSRKEMNEDLKETNTALKAEKEKIDGASEEELNTINDQIKKLEEEKEKLLELIKIDDSLRERQLSNPWIEQNLDKEIGTKCAREIIYRMNYGEQSVYVFIMNVDKGGKVIFKDLDGNEYDSLTTLKIGSVASPTV